MVEFEKADEAEQIANELIPECPVHLLDARILYLFTTQKRRKDDKVVLGSSAKMAALPRFLSSGLTAVEEGFDFLILFGADEWKDLTLAQRRALVDHELCHCYFGFNKGERVWRLRGHDVEEFSAVIERHGLWKSDVRAFSVRVADIVGEQLKLPTPTGGLDDN